MAKGQYTDGPQELLSCFITDSGSFSILTSSRALSYPIKVNELNYEITLNVYRVGKCCYRVLREVGYLYPSITRAKSNIQLLREQIFKEIFSK